MKTLKKTIKFQKWKCKVQVGKYAVNDRTALMLVDAKSGELIADGTVNLPENPLMEGEVIVKDYGTNKGMYKALFEAGIVGPISRYAYSGHIIAPICELLTQCPK
jgi:hypothetical protein